MKLDIQQEINFEVAMSFLNDLVGRTNLEKLAEQKKEHPDQSLIARLNDKFHRFWDERSNLHYDNHAEIERVLNEYGPILKNGLSVLDA
ncbi:MAG: hypothetical protein ACYCZR_08025 [Burkholderiales bacterium]